MAFSEFDTQYFAGSLLDGGVLWRHYDVIDSPDWEIFSSYLFANFCYFKRNLLILSNFLIVLMKNRRVDNFAHHRLSNLTPW